MNIYAAILMGVICFWAGHRAGRGKTFVYIGNDQAKYNNALFGILLKYK